MKVAILVYGEYREFDNVVDSWKILDSLDSDFYFSTWNKSKQNNKKLGIFREFDVTHEMILKHYPKAIIDIRYPDDCIELHDNWGSSAKIYNHWKNCVKLLEDSKKEYDFILILRPDLYLSLSDDYNEFSLETLKSIYKENSVLLYGDYKKYDDINGNPIFFASDYFMFGSYDILKKLLIDSSNFGGDIHYSLGKYMFDLNIEPIINKIIKTDIVRPNAFYINFDGISIKINPINESFYNRDYFHRKQVEWDSTLIKKPLSD